MKKKRGLVLEAGLGVGGSCSCDSVEVGRLFMSPDCQESRLQSQRRCKNPAEEEHDGFGGRQASVRSSTCINITPGLCPSTLVIDQPQVDFASATA